MVEGKQAVAHKAHVLIFPAPAQGHINPMLQFGKRLVHKGLKVSLVAGVAQKDSMEAQTGPVNVEFIHDGQAENHNEDRANFEANLERYIRFASSALMDLITRLAGSATPVDCLVYDAFTPWALDIAKKAGIPGASFFTQSAAVDAIYYHGYHGSFTPPSSSVESVSFPGLPELLLSDLPSFVEAPDSFPSIRKFILDQYTNVEKADWVVCNTVDELEDEELKWLKTIMPVRAIGPTVPSFYLDKRIEWDDDYSLSLWKKESSTCNGWLDSKDDKSVVYVSFGSLTNLGPEQMEEMAFALKESDHHFLWVVRATEASKLPSKFVEETKEKGLIVQWCSQLQVLQHKAVGCFVTHCGWNSALEALSLGVPMVACPQWSDQPTNAKYMEDVWRVGVRARAGEKNIVGREEVKSCIREVMEEGRREEMKRNACKWRKVMKEALEDGGSSDRNIEEFVTALCKPAGA